MAACWLFAACWTMSLIGSSDSHRKYQALIPNGYNVTYNGSSWPAVGHGSPSSGDSMNPFGNDFHDYNDTWTVDLCNLDSDGDGRSNGIELGDPFCTWVPGMTPAFTVGITHPGFKDAPPAGSATPANSTANATSSGSDDAGVASGGKSSDSAAGNASTGEAVLRSSAFSASVPDMSLTLLSILVVAGLSWIR